MQTLWAVRSSLVPLDRSDKPSYGTVLGPSSALGARKAHM